MLGCDVTHHVASNNMPNNGSHIIIYNQLRHLMIVTLINPVHKTSLPVLLRKRCDILHHAMCPMQPTILVINFIEDY